MINYSIAIRTLGLAGEKYQKLLDSIDRLNDKPQRVIVVLPIGYEEPKEKLGYEKVVYTEKSMIMQRIYALNYIDSDYVLFVDDDIEFESDFIKKLYLPLKNDEFAVSSGPLLSFFPPDTLKYKIASLLGGACVMLHGRNKDYVRILKSGGWSYNYSIDESKIYNTESLPWTCFFMKTELAKEIRMEDELWLEKNGYAAFDDRVMLYKIIKNGYKACIVGDAKYIHNDAKTSTREIKLTPVYCGAFNHFVFWHRFIFKMDKGIIKLWDLLCIIYYIIMGIIYNLLLVLLRRNSTDYFLSVLKGFVDGIKFIFTDEYKRLNSVIIDY